MGVIYFNSRHGPKIHPCFLGKFEMRDEESQRILEWQNALALYSAVRARPCKTFTLDSLNETEQHHKSVRALHEGIIRALCADSSGYGINRLMSTHPHVLIYDNNSWGNHAELGCGSDGKGENLLGIALMAIRHAFISCLNIQPNIFLDNGRYARRPLWYKTEQYQRALDSFPAVELGGTYEAKALIKRLLFVAQPQKQPDTHEIKHESSASTMASTSDFRQVSRLSTAGTLQSFHSQSSETLTPVEERRPSCVRRIFRRCFRR